MGSFGLGRPVGDLIGVGSRGEVGALLSAATSMRTFPATVRPPSAICPGGTSALTVVGTGGESLVVPTRVGRSLGVCYGPCSESATFVAPTGRRIRGTPVVPTGVLGIAEVKVAIAVTMVLNGVE